MYATRLKAVLAVLAVGVVVVLASLAQMQILEGSYYREEAEQRLRRPPGFRPTIRGTIYDRNGLAVAQDTGAFDVGIYFPFIELDDVFVRKMARKWGVADAEVRTRVARMWTDLARLTGVPADELTRRAEVIRARVEVIRTSVVAVHGRPIRVREETYGERTSVAHPIVYDVDLKAVGAISSRADEFPGLVVQPTRKREYPYGNVAPHVIGMVGEVSAEDLAEGGLNEPYPRGNLRRYWPGDLAGRGGVEGACEDLLRGARGMFQKGIEGNLLEDLDAVPGRDVHLTLDIALQSDVEELMDRASTGTGAGAAVVLDCRTGEVLVLASSPRYDLRTFGDDYAQLARNPKSPFLHRAIAGRYPMGSTFKAIAATAALEEGVITPRSFLTCEGILHAASPNRFRCHIYPSGHGAVPLRTAIQKSCNVFFYHIGEMLGRTADGKIDLRLGRDRLQAWASRFGLGRTTGLGLPGEAAGRIDVPDPRNLAIGQGELQVTPLQAAQVYGLVATTGQMPPLRLIRELAPPAGPGRPGPALHPQLMSALRDAFAAVVNEQGGTGYGYATLPDIRVAGKTGTAQAGRGEDHAWFTGFAPAENPRIAFAVIVEHGGHGGTAAAPIAREIVKACQAHGYLGEAPGEASGSGKSSGNGKASGKANGRNGGNGRGRPAAPTASPPPPAPPPPARPAPVPVG